MFRNSLRVVSRNLLSQKPIITTPSHSSLFFPKRSTHNVLHFQRGSLPVSLFRRDFHSTKGLASSEKQNEQKENSQNKDTEQDKESESQSEQQTPPPEEAEPSRMSRLKWVLLFLGSGSIGAVAFALSQGMFNDYFELRLDDDLYYPEDQAKGGFRYFLDRLHFMARNPHILMKYRLLPPAQYPAYTVILDTTDIIHFELDITRVGHMAWLRPHVADFIGFLKDDVELILWSTHVDPLITERVLRTFNQVFSGSLGRMEAYNVGRHVFKDLNRVNRPLSHVILISSDPEYGALQPDNTILIPPYHGEPDDETFQQLTEVILGINEVYPAGRYDVRNILSSYSWRNPLEGHIISSRHTKKIMLRELLDCDKVTQFDEPDDYP